VYCRCGHSDGPFGHIVIKPVGEQRLDRLACAFVQNPAALDQHRVVGDFLGQSVLELVFDVVDRLLLVNELA
jgi:hypothetical protein